MEKPEEIEVCTVCGASDNVELWECERCTQMYCENCGAQYNQFTQIDYNCCGPCSKSDR